MEILDYILGLSSGIVATLGFMLKFYEVSRKKPKYTFDNESFCINFKLFEEDGGGGYQEVKIDHIDSIPEKITSSEHDYIFSVSVLILINNIGHKTGTVIRFELSNDYLESPIKFEQDTKVIPSGESIKLFLESSINFNQLNALREKSSILFVTDNTNKKHKIKLDNPEY